jgi:RNA polymerase sigma-70 factor (ECF subfamily)
MRNENALAGQPIPKCHSPNAQSDEALMKAIAAGDQSAMRTLYARHNVRLYHFIARMVTDAGRAEDLVSEVFIDVWRQADRFEGVRRFRLGSCRLRASRRCRRFIGAGIPRSTRSTGN